MRKLKLQMQMTANGYVGGPNGELDWMTWDWDDKLKDYAAELTKSFDTILLGRKMTDGFIKHWSNVTKNPKDETYEAAKKFIDTPKVVFTKTLSESQWDNTTLAKGDLTEEVNKLKNQEGIDIIVYGGAGFVSSLVKAGLIDDYFLFMNPTAIPTGMTIFGDIDAKRELALQSSTSFDCGITVQHYKDK
jgi:dihydrofolate reductase